MTVCSSTSQVIFLYIVSSTQDATPPLQDRVLTSLGVHTVESQTFNGGRGNVPRRRNPYPPGNFTLRTGLWRPKRDTSHLEKGVTSGRVTGQVKEISYRRLNIDKMNEMDKRKTREGNGGGLTFEVLPPHVHHTLRQRTRGVVRVTDRRTSGTLSLSR